MLLGLFQIQLYIDANTAAMVSRGRSCRSCNKTYPVWQVTWVASICIIRNFQGCYQSCFLDANLRTYSNTMYQTHRRGQRLLLCTWYDEEMQRLNTHFIWAGSCMAPLLVYCVAVLLLGHCIIIYMGTIMGCCGIIVHCMVVLMGPVWYHNHLPLLFLHNHGQPGGTFFLVSLWQVL